MHRLVDYLYRMARPAVFALTDPEWAHGVACRAISQLDEYDWLADTVGRLGGYANHQRELGQTVGGVYFPNPVGLAAGFDKTGELAHGLHLLGFGSVETGTFTLLSREGNAKPRLERASGVRGLYNRMGWNGPGAVVGASKLSGRVRTVPIGVNVGPTPNVESVDEAIQSVIATVRVLATSADYFVINPSCSNVRVVDFQRPSLLSVLVEALRDALPEIAGKMIFVKLRTDTTTNELDRIGRACEQRKIGLVIGNTLGTDLGALSGPQLYNGIPGFVESLPERVKRAYQATGGVVPIVACGGIETAEQVYELIRRGASLIQVLTAWIYGGPFLVREINEELVRLLRRNGFSNISEIRGTYSGR